MKNKSPIQGVYLVTDTATQGQYDHIELTRMAIEGGVSVVQFRDKQMPPREAVDVIREMVTICEHAGATLMVNDRVDLAMAAGAHGVHLGQNDLPVREARRLMEAEKIIGGTASNLEEAQQVELAGADYLGFGHIYPTTTKQKDYAPRGPDMLKQVCETLDIPVIAIGGIDATNAANVLEQGAAGYAVSSAICRADKPVDAARELRDIFEWR